MQKWRDIRGYEGYYQVSNEGMVRSLERAFIIPYLDGTRKRTRKGQTLTLRKTGRYFQVSLSREGVKKQPLVHRLVAESFIFNVERKPQINHIDGNKLNNKLENLEWCTAKENAYHSVNVLGNVKDGGIQKTSKAVRAINEFCSMEFKSIREASRQGFIRHMIQGCLNGKYRQHGGFKWERM